MDLRDVFFDELYTLAQKDKNLVFVTADMGAHSLARFKKDFPDRYINVGVAEQNMINVAAGLSLGGKHVFVYSITPFTTLRCLEQIKINLCCMKQPVTIIGMGTGFTYGNDGPTHHALDDLAIMRTLPELHILNPCDLASTKACAHWAHKHQTPTYVRLEKGQWPSVYDQILFDTTQGLTEVRKGKDVVIVSTGIMLHRALEAADVLEKNGISAGVIDVFRIKPIDADFLISKVSEVKGVVVIEENMLAGGLGSIVCELLADYHKQVAVKRIGIPDEFCFTPGDRGVLQNEYGLSVEKVVSTILNWHSGIGREVLR